MSRRLWSALFVLVGLALVVCGADRWLRHRAAASVAERFLTALRDGDQAAVLEVLHPDVLPKVKHQIALDQRVFAHAFPELIYRVREVEIGGERAAVQLIVKQGGFVLQPTVRLSRDQARAWKVLAVDGLTVDPTWFDLQERRAREDGSRLAARLEQALQSTPGVEVHRVSLGSPRNPSEPGTSTIE